MRIKDTRKTAQFRELKDLEPGDAFEYNFSKYIRGDRIGNSMIHVTNIASGNRCSLSENISVVKLNAEFVIYD